MDTISKEVIKQIIDSNLDIVLPYKSSLDDPFSEVRLRYSTFFGGYMLSGGDINIKSISFDEVYEEFLKLRNNVGMILMKVLSENPDLEPEYCLEDREKIENLIKEQMKKNNLQKE